MNRFRTVDGWRLACALSVGLLAGAAQAEGSTLLRLALEPGASYRYAMTQTQEMTMSLGPMGEQRTSGENRMEFRQDVVEVREDGAAVIDFAYERIVMGVTAPGASMTFDSAADPDTAGATEPMAGLARSMVGKTIRMVMSPRGEILEVEGVDELLDAVLAQFADEPGAPQVAEMLRKSFGEETIRGMMQQGFVMLPEQAVAAGDRWSQEMVLPATPMGRLVVHADYEAGATTERRGRDCIEVGVKMKMTVEGESPMAEQFNEMFRQQGQEASIDWEIGETRGTGTMWIEKSTGLTIESSIDQTMGMTIDITTADQAQSLHMEMDLEQTVSVELLTE